jgi:pantoate--beta-alanine ligase
MIVCENAKSLVQWRDSLSQSRHVGFVPTMGALHEGHLSLIQKAKRECDPVVVSIFVNPTQFNDPGDLKNYPRPLNEDLEFLKNAGVHAAFVPEGGEMYADRYRFEVLEKDFSRKLCGASRPGHFNGVLTVVLKLLNLVRPHRVYFGEKDYQQLRLIEDMVQALFLPVEVVRCPTVREIDGLAMSSRNRLLSPAAREIAPLRDRRLSSESELPEIRQELEQAGFRVDYLEELDGRRFVAAFLGQVRLIDNVEI